MLITFQFPICDARPFLPNLMLRREQPDWPDPRTDINPQFVHRFGKAIDRTRDPDGTWPDELKYCHIKRGLRFDRLEAHSVRLPSHQFRPRCAFRRFFSDGWAVSRVEVGISQRASRSNPLVELRIDEILSIIHDISAVPTIVPKLNGDTKPRPLVTQGQNMANLYAHGSMHEDASTSEQTIGMGLVESGSPLIVVEVSPEEANLDQSPIGAEGVTDLGQGWLNGAVALHCRMQVEAGVVSVCVIQNKTASSGELRSLRLCMTRLHSEREVLDLIIKQIHRKRLMNPPTEDAANLLDEYFTEKLNVVNRDTWGGVKQSQILAAFDAVLSIVRPASQALLISRYERSRRQVWQKVAAFQEQRRAEKLVSVFQFEKGTIMVDKKVIVSGTGNIVNVAEYMSGVTNTVNNLLAESKAGEEVKSLVKTLNSQIEQVAPEADPAQVKKLGKNLEALTKELASEEPERRWYEVSLTGLKEAAEAVGELAAPILATVAKLTAFLLPA